MGRIFSLISMICFSLNFYFTKISLSGGFENSLARGLVCLVCLYLISLFTKEKLFTTHKETTFVVLRSLLAPFLGISLSFALKFVKLSVFVVVSRTKAILMAYFGVWFLGDKFDYRSIIAAIIGIIGVSLVIAPGIYGFVTEDKNTLAMEWTPGELFGLFLTFVYMIVDCIDYLMLVIISEKNSPDQTNFIYYIFSCLMNGSVLAADHTTTWRTEDIGAYLGMGFSFYLANYLYVEGAALETNIAIQGTLQTSTTLFSVIFDILFLGVRLSMPNIIGCLLIVGSTLWVVLLSDKDKPEEIKDESSNKIQV